MQDDYDPLKKFREREKESRVLKLKLSIPFLLIPLLFSIVSIYDPSILYNLFHEKKIEKGESPIILGLDFKGGTRIVYQAEDLKWKNNKEIKDDLEESRVILSERLSGYGNFEPSIKADVDKNQIIIELPLGYNFDRITELIGQTGNLEVHLLKEGVDLNDILLHKPPDSILQEIIFTKDDIVNAELIESPKRYIKIELKDKLAVTNKLGKYPGRTVLITVSGTAFDHIGIGVNFNQGSSEDGDNYIVISNDSSPLGMEKTSAEYTLKLLNWETLPLNFEPMGAIPICP